MVLSIAPLVAGQENYYLDLAREDYREKGGEPPGRWMGTGARKLGLIGAIQEEQVFQLLGGHSPEGHRDLVQIQNYTDGRARQPGWDLTFSAPKSVSVLWSQADAPLRAAIELAQWRAVEVGLAYLEYSASHCRRGKGGVDTEQAFIVAAAFEHGTSRAQDPNLHTHALVINVAERRDGTWGTLRSKDLFDHKMAAGALYRIQLAHELFLLGLGLKQERTWFELKIVPSELLGIFSTRRNKIEQALAEQGVRGAKASAYFATTTRAVKSHVAREELRLIWKRIGEESGFSPPALEELSGRTPLKASKTARLLDESIKESTQSLASRDNTFFARDLVRDIAQRNQAQGIDASSVVRAVEQVILGGAQLVELGQDNGYERFTTASVLKLEKMLLELCERYRASSKHSIEAGTLANISKENFSLSESQQQALAQLLGAPGSVRCLSGLSGTGKTTTLAAARRAWQRSGYTVLGVSLSARGARRLETTIGIPCETVASLRDKIHPPIKKQLVHHTRQLGRAALKRPTKKLKRPAFGKKTVLVIDDASRVDTKAMLQLVRAVVRKGGLIVLSGDSKQVPAMEGPGAFAALVRKLGSAELTEIHRQDEDWMKHAVKQFAEGNARQALTQYLHAGRLHIEDTREIAKELLIKDWLSLRTDKASETVILTDSRAVSDDLNERAQRIQIRQGRLSLEDRVRIGSNAYHIGDRVVFTDGDRQRGWLNGDRATVVSVVRGRLLSGNSIVVSLDDATRPIRRITLSHGDRDSFTLGYALPARAAQDLTVERAFVFAAGPQQDRELTYLEVSRASELAHIYSSAEDVGEDLQETARVLARSHQKELAHEVAPSANYEMGYSR